MKYTIRGNLSISTKLLDFINNELLPGTKISSKKFWDGLDKYAHELTPKNKKLLEIREDLQKKIDIWHRDNKGEITSNEGFSVVAPIKMIVPLSTAWSKESC